MNRRGAFLGAMPLVLILGLVLVQQVPGILDQSPTFDEKYHLFAGYDFLHTGRAGYLPEHPPLIWSLLALPLLALNVERPVGTPNKGDFAHRFLFENTIGPGRMLLWSRLMASGLTLLLVFAVYRWSKDLWGSRAGWLAALLAALNPSLIAHGSLVTNDVGVSAFFFLAVYAFWRFLKTPSPGRLLMAGSMAGLALSSKFSGIAIVPVLAVLGFVYLLDRERQGEKKGGYLILWLTIICLTAGLVVFITYGAEFRPVWEMIQHVYTYMPEHLDPLEADPTVDFSLARVPVPAPSYLYGLWLVGRDVSEGRSTFLWGQRSGAGYWYYFPAAFLVKTPLPVQILLGLAVAILVRTWSRSWYDFLFLALPAGTWLGLAMFSRLNLGYRHVLPILPFLFVMVGRLAGAPLPRWRRAVVLALTGWLALSAVMIFPYHLAYFNELVGGPEEGYRYLVDSNLDWGQDLKRLARYQRGRGIGTLHLAYFGTADPNYYGIEYDCLPSLGLLACDDAPIPRRGTLAVSATCLQGGCTQDPSAYRWLLSETPVAKIGYSIFVYELSGED
jgi:4-amino-4-deoxy-L-arabinose transferase-like glycosyltransferase